MIPTSGFLLLQENAKDIIVETGIIGKLFENASPFEKLNPILRPVKEPGPILTAIALTSDNSKPMLCWRLL